MSTRMMNGRELPPTKHARLASLALGSALALVACSDLDDGQTEGRAASALIIGDSVVVEWNEIAVSTLGAIAPFTGTRAMAAVQVAVFEAVNAITGEYAPYFGTISAPLGADAQAAAIVAAHDVLVWLVPAQAADLDTRRDASLAAIAEGEANTDGIAVGQGVGQAAAAAVIAARTGDGSAPPQFYVPTSSAPYQWQLTPGCPPAGGAFYHWQNVKPYGVQSSSQFRAPPPPALDSHRYAADFNEVKAVGDVRAGTDVRSDYYANVVRIYAAQPPHVGWNSVARQILANRQDSITDTARTLAMMNMSLSDAHITVFETKYFYTTWRPETAIPRGGEDGNDATEADPTWTPFIVAASLGPDPFVTPCFPSYPSAHGAGAASRVLEKAYGRFHTIVNSTPAVPGVELSYTDLKDIVTAVSDARVYGGIHFRFEQDAGEALGREVANYNNAHHLRPLQSLAPPE